jgi:hypothetical protein
MDTTTAAGTSSMAPPPDYHSCTGTPAPTTTLAVGWQQMQCSIDLLIATQRESNFLRMIDRKAPILYEADVVANAIRRYEIYWLPMQVYCNCRHISIFVFSRRAMLTSIIFHRLTYTGSGTHMYHRLIVVSFKTNSSHFFRCFRRCTIVRTAR